MSSVIASVCFLVLAPFLGGFLDGLDRKISARMQGRIGPPVLQPFYDVRKLFNKQTIVVNKAQTFLMLTYMAVQIFVGVLFFDGLLHRQHLCRHIPASKMDGDPVARLNLCGCFRRTVVDGDTSRVACLVCHGAPLDQARNFQIFI